MTRKKPRENVLRSLFDIKPVTGGGRLDWEKISAVRQIVNFNHLIEGYERPSVARRMKLLVSDRRGNEIFRRYLHTKKKAFGTELPGGTAESGVVEAVMSVPKEIVLEYRPQVVRSMEIVPSREELLNQLEIICNNDFAPVLVSERQPKDDFSGKRKAGLDNFQEERKRVSAALVNLSRRFNLLKTKIDWRLWATGLAAVIVALALTFPLFNLIEKGVINPRAGGSLAARENILKSRDLLAMVDFYQNPVNFEGQEKDLIVSKQKIDKISSALLGILDNLPNDNSDSVASLVDLTRLFNQASDSFASAIEFYSNRNFFNSLTKKPANQEAMTAILARSDQNFEQVVASLGQIKEKMSQIDRRSLPADAADEILKLGDKTSVLNDTVQGILDSNRFLMKFFGAEKPVKFLLVVQNNGTPRASGGFVSGYAVVGMDKGSITDLTVEDALSTDAKIRERVIPPQPLQGLNISWGMSSANWFFDFPLSAQKLQWFEEKAGGPKVDYVVAASPKFFEDLLKITGSINLAETKKNVSADNFGQILTDQVKIEDSPAVVSRPFSKILAEFLPDFFNELGSLEQSSYFRSLDLINKNLEEKNILVYAADQTEEDYLKKTGWSGESETTGGNFLAIADSVINGGLNPIGQFKKQFHHQAAIQADGRVVNTLILTYDYPGKTKNGSGPSGTEPEFNDFLRIFVPAGSELVEASIQPQNGYLPPLDYYAAGFRTDSDVTEMEYDMITDASGVQIFSEGGKTVFGFWVNVAKGESRTVIVKYRLPLRSSGEKDSYSLLIQKQPGDYADFESDLTFPEDYKPTGRSTENLQVFSDIVKLSGQLDRDKYYEVRFER